MICPKCGAPEDNKVLQTRRTDKVIDSRHLGKENIIRRRRECLYCKHRWTTYEMIFPKLSQLLLLAEQIHRLKMKVDEIHASTSDVGAIE